MILPAPPLPRSAVAEACRHAASTYPEECCGFIRRSGTVHRATNIQGIEPGRAPALDDRLADRAFNFAGTDLYALGGSFRGDDPAICIYHSHPEAGAYFSAMDRREALYAGLPRYPVVQHRIQGLAVGLVPDNFDISVVDGFVSVTYDEAKSALMRLLDHEGIGVGLSTGANIAACIRLARERDARPRILCCAYDQLTGYIDEFHAEEAAVGQHAEGVVS
jgi:proteasome lid subunit RPN8/RPN11